MSEQLEHSAEQPLPRGAPQVCVNASNGAEIWRVNGMFRNTRWGGNGIIGDSIIATMDTYDQRIYAIGKGPTEVTVDVPGAGLISGQSVMIRGSVTDISPGTETYAIKCASPTVFQQSLMQAKATGCYTSTNNLNVQTMQPVYQWISS